MRGGVVVEVVVAGHFGDDDGDGDGDGAVTGRVGDVMVW